MLPEFPQITEKPHRRGRPSVSRSGGNTKTDEEGWSVRIRTSIKDVMLEHLAKGILSVFTLLMGIGELPPMCACCGDVLPTSWRHVVIEGKNERFCNGLFKCFEHY